MTGRYFTNLQSPAIRSCDFCGIISGREARTIRYEDDDLMVFKNQLPWVPVMLLVVPKVHLTQKEFWRSPLFAKAAALAVSIGEQDSPDGFRFVSNFGEQAAQTQTHGHLHVLGGGELGLYMDFPRKGDYWLRRFGTTEGDEESRQRREEERKQREAQQAHAPTQEEQR